jgi:hypothetical protein
LLCCAQGTHADRAGAAQQSKIPPHATVQIAQKAGRTCRVLLDVSAPASIDGANDTEVAPSGWAGRLPSFCTSTTDHSPVSTLHVWTERFPSLDAAATIRPSSAGAKATLLMEPAECAAGCAEPWQMARV